MDETLMMRNCCCWIPLHSLASLQHWQQNSW